MQNPVHILCRALTGGDVADVTFQEFASLRHPFTLAIDQAVQHPHLVAAPQQAFAKMTADEAGAAGDQHAFHGALLYRLWKKVRSSFVLMPRASVASITS